MSAASRATSAPLSASGAPIAQEVPAAQAQQRAKRPRLVHVDAMRPVKQFGVVSTHSLQTFGVAASLGVGGTLMVTHVTRYAFMFISAAMLVYAYPRLDRSRLKVFWRRRLLAVVVPYLTWTVIYFLMGVVQDHGAGGVLGNLEHLGFLVGTGYDQLYYLVLLVEFYAVYPLILWAIRRTQRHHWTLLAVVLLVQIGLAIAEHWRLVPPWLEYKYATRELWNYLIYVFAGGVMAWHYHRVHAWMCRHWRSLVAGTVVAFCVSEAWYVLAARHFSFLAGVNPSDPFQPVEIPLFIGLIAVVYLLGVWLGDTRRPRWLRQLTQAGADYSYGIYLSQVLFITVLSELGWEQLNQVLPWQVATFLGIVVVFSASWALSAVLARLPGARGTAGIARRPWRYRREVDDGFPPAAPAGPTPAGG